MTIKAIDTEYNGYRFRSRLEARWAVFFDAAGIRYEYEPEGYEIDNVDGGPIRYLPDFYLPDFDVHCEVKPNDKELFKDSSKLGWMVDFCGPMASGLILLGPIPYYEYPDYPAHDMLYWDKGVALKKVRFKERRHGYPTELHDVDGQDGLDYTTSSIPKKASVIATYFDESYLGDKDAGIEASSYLRARQARFEYGETPVMTNG